LSTTFSSSSIVQSRAALLGFGSPTPAYECINVILLLLNRPRMDNFFIPAACIRSTEGINPSRLTYSSYSFSAVQRRLAHPPLSLRMEGRKIEITLPYFFASTAATVSLSFSLSSV
jgi:hypothetical protein